MEQNGVLRMLKWIFFDIGSTLTDESRAYRHRAEDAVKGTYVPLQQFMDTMLCYYRQNKKGDLEAAKHYGLTLPKWHSEYEILYPDAVQCLRTLHAHYPIGVVANQPPGTKERLRDFGVLPYIDLVIASAEEGLAKPDPAIFQLALQRADCLPEQAVMVGDRLDNDIAPAKKLGMKTIWIRQGFGGLSAPGSEAETPDFKADSLTDVCRILMERRNEDAAEGKL